MMGTQATTNRHGTVATIFGFLTPIVVPVVYTYLDDVGRFVAGVVRRWTGAPDTAGTRATLPAD